MLFSIYRKLLQHFGPQNWWPAGSGFQPREWEICIGAILTQNTSWSNVGKALHNLRNEGILSPEQLVKTQRSKLEKLVQPSGYFRQKSQRLQEFAEFILSFSSFREFQKNVTREQLLQVNGIGRETADSILLYVCNRPIFIIDSYTRRIFSRTGMIDANLDYDDIRMYLEYQLGSLHSASFHRKNPGEKNSLRSQEYEKSRIESLLKEAEIVKMYNEYHALLVVHAKNFCTKSNPKCKECPINNYCKHGAKILGKEGPSFDTRGSLSIFGGQ